ncbi:MAG TPA: ABC transporter ATP-binding protein [Chloroflexi bacterium]|nr:ABC transporter ATP-binding protein [Chloroflexota bacterium]HHW85795.1 ABC transporter ATP-binding protein [Chloroflexota bacterium]
MTSSEFSVTQPWRSNTRSAPRWVFTHVRRNWAIIAVILAGAIGNAGLAAAIPIFTGAAFDAITGASPDLRALALACVLLVVSQAVRSGLQLGRNFGSEVLGQRLERDARRELYGELLGKSMGFHDLHATGDVMARATNDVRELALMMAPGLNLVIGSAIFLVMPILVAPRYHPTLVIVPVLFALGYLLAMWHYLRTLQPVTATVRRVFGEMNARLTEAVEGIETVKGAAQEEREVALFERNATRVRDAIVAQAHVEARFLPLLLLALATGVAFGQALYLYNAGVITIGAVAAYVGLISLFDFPVFTSLFAYSQVASGLSSARRILELIRAQAVVDQNRAGHAASMQGAVHFDHVSFQYAPGGEKTAATQRALEDVSFTLAPGQTLALVGQTGAGKSTVAKLINRIYDVDQGAITIDGVDVRDWNLEVLRQQISIIEQDIFLFSRSIAENIAFGKPDATQAEIEAAARAAQAHDFIMSFPDGYATVVGERGMMLSGGQRQRIALARAFLTNPAILILDDSTSAIDSATEDQIQQAIERASEGRTTILITHRLSQIRWADKIVVLRQGRVAAQGAHADLIRQSQAYRDIFAQVEAG